MSFIRKRGFGGRRALLVTALLAGLAACGGSTSQRDPFVAQRLFAFGDDASALVANPASNTAALKYGVNVDVGVSPAVTIDCAQQPLWIQSLAALYGFTFKECNPANVAEPLAATFAAAGARVADIDAQVAKVALVGGFREKDLVTVLLGVNDVLEAYQAILDSNGAVTEAQVTGELRARAERLANKINGIVGQGARVIVSTLPDLGLSPYGQTQETLDAGRAALLTRLTIAFNEQLGVKILLDGSLIGLVQADQMVQAMNRSPGSFNLTNAVAAVCLPERVPPNCTTKAESIIPGGDPGTFLWADGTRMSFGGQSYLGRLAIDRATRNPF